MNRYRIVLHQLLATMLLLTLGACASSPPPDRQPQAEADADMYGELGIEAFQSGDYVAAEAMFRRSLQYFESVDDTAGVLRTRINLAQTALQARDFGTASYHLERARSLEHSLQQETGLAAQVRLLQSSIEIRSGRPRDAMKTLAPLLPQFSGTRVKNTPDRTSLTALANRTRIAFLVADDDAQLWTARFQSGLETSGIGDAGLDARLWRFRSTLARRNGDMETAEAALNEALAAYKRVPSQTGIAATLADAGDIALERADISRAREYYLRAASIRVRLADQAGTAGLLDKLARTETGRAGKKRARKISKFARQLRDSGSPDWEAAGRLLREIGGNTTRP